jgi:site-specific DNA-methyltransferase (adenine-specific)
VTRKVYSFVPKQDWSRRWSDEQLYEKYNISAAERTFIERVVRPMDLSADPFVEQSAGEVEDDDE